MQAVNIGYIQSQQIDCIFIEQDTEWTQRDSKQYDIAWWQAIILCFPHKDNSSKYETILKIKRSIVSKLRIFKESCGQQQRLIYATAISRKVSHGRQLYGHNDRLLCDTGQS